ncbi:MAG TPA: hypothetical protein PK011_02630 [Marinagarivorans sp.]|nr:hypothetical protein [Marinagarivorans sp.]HNG60003.1 hypothetical protein [Cellvibrionaceae bacterium]
MIKTAHRLSIAVLSVLSTACVAPNDHPPSSSSSSSSSSGSSSSSSSGAPGAYLSVKGGYFTRTPAGTSRYSTLNGLSNLIIRDNSSEIEIHVQGLTANAQYKSVLTRGTCFSIDSNATYRQGLGGNEITPTISVDAFGMGMAKDAQNFALNDTDLSLAIKDLGNENTIACADLHSSAGIKGMVRMGKSYYYNWVGYVSANDNGHSRAEINPSTGFRRIDTSGPVDAYANMSNCNSEPMEYGQSKGGHGAENSLWPHAEETEAFLGIWASNPFKVRLNEIKSLVFSEQQSQQPLPYRCIDLDTKLLTFRSGSFKPTDAGVALYGTLAGRAILETSLEGNTTASITMAGLKPNTTYSNHVHNGLCADAGGNHYLHDIHGADNAVNGMFPVFTTDATGYVHYQLSANKIVRPDARSIVIHEPGSGVKIACADLD